MRRAVSLTCCIGLLLAGASAVAAPKPGGVTPPPKKTISPDPKLIRASCKDGHDYIVHYYGKGQALLYLHRGKEAPWQVAVGGHVGAGANNKRPDGIWCASFNGGETGPSVVNWCVDRDSKQMFLMSHNTKTNGSDFLSLCAVDVVEEYAK